MTLKQLGVEWVRYNADNEEQLRCWGRTCIAAFGVDRSMFESNFPPGRASSSLPILWNSFKKLIANYSATEKAMLFSDTAKRLSPRLTDPCRQGGITAGLRLRLQRAEIESSRR